MPALTQDESVQCSAYNLHPAFPVEPGTIGGGYLSLARTLSCAQVVRIDGYVGVDWETLTEQLRAALLESGVQVRWVDVSNGWRTPLALDRMVAPFLGGDDPLFGTRYPGTLSDFLDPDRWSNLGGAPPEPTIFYGCGAALIDGRGPLLYVDLPKDELQRRSNSGLACNLGAARAAAPKEQYKRFYFVDWPVLNRHKAQIVNSVDWIIDGSDPEQPTFVSGNSFRAALDAVSRTAFRPRPWFAPGPWGGQWLKRKVPDAPQETPNFAWSFELIAPEQGIAFGDGAATLEASFDWLMFYRGKEVLGDCVDRFGDEFPIRFDFLDTFDGGNLSLQCHPRPEYIRQQFGESFTQDETYYILDCQPEARVFLGFHGGVDGGELRACLERSAEQGTPVDVERFVAAHPAAKHDLFLIPHGTVHCSGAGNLVLEISATPYVFTFKMYDWLRADLDGKPRPLNIERAFDNLDFEMQGDRVQQELLSRPRVLQAGDDWQVVHLPTHPKHFYDVHRFEFDGRIEGATSGSPHVMMVVEGGNVTVETPAGPPQRFNYAETFVVPAAARSYRLVNNGPGRAMVVAAFVKPEHASRS